MNQEEIIKTLISKYGAIDVLRFYTKELHSSLTSMKVGIADNNQMLAVKDLEHALNSLSYLERIISNNEYKPSVKHLEKEII